MRVLQVLPHDLDFSSDDCFFHNATINITRALWRRTRAQLIENGRDALCSHFVNATRIHAEAQMLD